MSSSSQYALPSTLPSVEGYYPETQPIDGFKLAVAQLVAKAWEEDVAKIVAGVDTGKKGADLAVAVPRFKKGKPDEWAKKVVDAVSVGCLV